MHNKATLTLLAVAMIAAPLSAQLVVRSGGEVARRNDRIPPGQLPPRGLCRVWINGVPPGQQPPVTDCATAERNRVANSRVIYGDRETFRGRKNAVKRATLSGDVARQCTVWDAVVVDGRVVNVCRDDNAQRDRRGRVNRRDDQDDNDDNNAQSGNNDNDDNKVEKRDNKSKVKANKGNKKDKHGDHDDGDHNDGDRDN